MYSKTKYKMSFSRITSLSFTIFGWFIFRNDWHKERPINWWKTYSKATKRKRISLSYYLHFSQIHTLFPWVIFLLHLFNCHLLVVSKNTRFSYIRKILNFSGAILIPANRLAGMESNNALTTSPDCLLIALHTLPNVPSPTSLINLYLHVVPKKITRGLTISTG